MNRTSEYQRLSVAEKQTRHREAMREPAIPCPHCDTQTTASDLLRHVETSCPGRRQPHPLAKWVTWGEALELGVSRDTLSRWVRKGWVASRSCSRQEGPARPGRPAKQEYLLRDITKLLALRKAVSPALRTNSDRPS